MKKALGKGLSALIPDSYIDKQNNEKSSKIAQPGALKVATASHEQSGFSMIELSQIQPNHDQPRKEFSPDSIKELANSIKEKGILQPVVVKREGEKQYQLICGERRYRAATLCGLTKIPAVIKDVANHELLEWALIENIQRQDLNALEEADAYRRLAEERMISHEEIAKRLGKSRTAITNSLRLLKLPDEVRDLINTELLSAGHARALLGLLTPEHQRQMARRILKENLSVRQVEAMVQRSNAQRRKPRKARNLTPEITDLEQKMTHHLGAQVKIYPRKNRNQGRIEVYYHSLDDLDRVIEKIQLPRS